MVIPISSKLASVNLFSKNQPSSKISFTTGVNSKVNDISSSQFIPINIQVSNKSRNSKQLTSSANAQIAKAEDINTEISKSLTDIYAILENLVELSEKASDSSYTDADRTEFNTQANEYLDTIENYYNSAELYDIKILQGGGQVISSGSNGEEYFMQYGNVDKTYLNINSIDLTTNASSSLTSLSSALEKVGGDIQNIDSEGKNLSSLRKTNNNSLSILNKEINSELSREAALEAFDMAKASILVDVEKLTELQGSKLSVSVVTNMLESLKTLSQAVEEITTDTITQNLENDKESSS